MNILLIAEKVSSLELPVNGEAGTHILQVFNAKLGDTIDIGVCNGPRGKAIIVRLNKNSLKDILLYISALIFDRVFNKFYQCYKCTYYD